MCLEELRLFESRWIDRTVASVIDMFRPFIFPKAIRCEESIVPVRGVILCVLLVRSLTVGRTPSVTAAIDDIICVQLFAHFNGR